MKPARRLPDQTIPRMKALVENSAPNPHRPHLTVNGEDLDAELAPLEQRTAQTYAEMEEWTYRIQRLADEIRSR